MKINGLLVVDGSFTSNANGSTIQVIDPGTGKSGILVNGNANITKGTYTVNGVIYTSGSMSVNNSDTMTITGAIVSGGAVNFNTGVALTLTLDTPRATAVFGGTTGTYTSAISHWEEEY